MHKDCVVIGAGPAGSIIARELSSMGLQVLVLERRPTFTQRAGETLPPLMKPLLKRLELWEAFLSTQPLESPGNVSLWGSEQLVANDFIFNPYGSGWHVDRACFDTLLSNAARKKKADVRMGVRILAIEWDNDGWRISFSNAGDILQVTAAKLVCATGRSNNPLPEVITRTRMDKLLGCYTFMPTGDVKDSRTWLEATEHGWWYSSTLPDQKTVFSFFTDADLLPKKRERQRWLCESLQSTYLMKKRFSSDPEQWFMADSRSSFIENSGHENLLLVGDAALSQDPLSSSGLVFCLESAMKAAQAIINEDKLLYYQEWLSDYWSEYLQNYKMYYGQVDRWQQSEFWVRRQL